MIDVNGTPYAIDETFLKRVREIAEESVVNAVEGRAIARGAWALKKLL